MHFLSEHRTPSKLEFQDADGTVVCRGRLFDEHLFGIEDVRMSDALPLNAQSQIGDALLAFCRDHACELLLQLRPAGAAMHKVLLAAGFTVEKSKVVVRRALENYVSPYPSPFQFRSLADLGVEPFAAIMLAASEGDPFDVTPPEESVSALQHLIDLAGSRFDPTSWHIALHGDEPAGVVLPQEYADTPGLGTLFYIGILPPFRGRGWGKILHALGLHALVRSGVARYVGSTDARNVAMLRVFAANGCIESNRQGFYAPAPSAPQTSSRSSPA